MTVLHEQNATLRQMEVQRQQQFIDLNEEINDIGNSVIEALEQIRYLQESIELLHSPYTYLLERNQWHRNYWSRLTNIFLHLVARTLNS